MLILSPHANRTPSLVSIIRNRHLRAGFCPSFLVLAKITHLVLRGKKRQKRGLQLAYESLSYLQTVSADSRQCECLEYFTVGLEVDNSGLLGS